MCTHEPQCPSAGGTAPAAARVIASHPEQGWSLLCNGVVSFDDDGLLLLVGRGACTTAQPIPVNTPGVGPVDGKETQ